MCILGRGMYPGYERYWSAVLADPRRILPVTGRAATEGEIAYARFAEKTPHIILSRTLDEVTWTNARIVRNVEDICRLKQQSGKNIYAVGGATLVGSLMNAGLVDELRLVVHPLILGGGKALFKDVKERREFTLRRVKALASGLVRLTYST
jgi:dihydrofolate reductase